MSATSLFVVQRLYAVWQAQDVRAVMKLCADDISYTVHQRGRPDRAAFRGKGEVSSYLQAVAGAWAFEELRPGPLHYADDIVRGRVDCVAVHRPTGEVIESSRRHVWRFRGDLILSCDECGDTDLIRAFCRMVAHA